MPANIKIPPSEIMFEEFKQKLQTSELAISQMLRLSAKVMLQKALKYEVNEFLQRDYYQNDPEKTAKLGRRNGYTDKTMLTAEGPIQLKVPQIRDSEKQFRLQILELYANGRKFG